ncbi:MAG: hypothetical protein ACI9Q3_001396 [Maribacter sp.]|jgi:hypothetical protein
MRNPILEIVNSVLGSGTFTDIFKGKETRKNEFLIELNKQLQTKNNAQIEINKLDAKSNNKFQSGWRPFIGYVCGFSLLYQIVIRNFLEYLILIFNPEFPAPPIIELTQLISILLAMLGMSGLRTYDKKK